MFKEGSLSLSAEGKIIRYSHSLAGILGYSAEEAVGSDFSLLSPPGMEGRHGAFFGDPGLPVSVIGHATKLRRKDGELLDIYLSVYHQRDTTGHLYSYLLTISVQKNEEPPAILSEEFQRIFKFSNDAVAVTDVDGQIIDVNNAFLSIYGYSREEVIGKNPRVLKSHHSTPWLYEKMWRDILDPDKGFWKGEIINLAKDGREVPVLLSINAIKGPDGGIRNFLGIAFDLSGQKELDRVNRLYIDYVIHDMRNPLTSISVNAEILLMKLKPTLPEALSRKIGMILSCTQKINSMMSDILDYSRARGGALVLKKEKVSLEGVLKSAFMPFENSGKRLFVNDRLYDGAFSFEGWVEADADKLQRIIYNLMSNAFRNAASEVRVLMDISGKGLRCTVSDDGKGFSALEAGRVFEMFYQTEDGVRTGGAGLGLSIVKSFVEAHGGVAWVEPGQGRGAAFGFTIPV